MSRIEIESIPVIRGAHALPTRTFVGAANEAGREGHEDDASGIWIGQNTDDSKTTYWFHAAIHAGSEPIVNRCPGCAAINTLQDSHIECRRIDNLIIERIDR